MKNNLGLTASVGVSVPIFDARRTKTNINKARIAQEQAHINYDNEEQDLYYTIEELWLDAINNYVASKGRADEKYKGMGTTLVGLAFYEGHFYSMNCGDSRLYRYRDGVLEQLTTDHSLSNLLGSEKHSSVITNCIGGGCSTSYIDMVQMTDDVRTDDVYLLCSDGLSDMISDNQIASLLASGADVNGLCEAAIEAGGFDNVSCCIIKL
jgi:protein phosphatase